MDEKEMTDEEIAAIREKIEDVIMKGDHGEDALSGECEALIEALRATRAELKAETAALARAAEYVVKTSPARKCNKLQCPEYFRGEQ